MRERPEARELSASVLRLTHALYRVTDLMPRDEPLRRGIREKAGEIFAAGVATAHGRANHEEKADEAWIGIEILLGYLTMARLLGSMNPMNFLVLEREYRMLAQMLATTSAEDMIKEGAGGGAALSRGQEQEPRQADNSRGTQKESIATATRPPADVTEPKAKANAEVNPVRSQSPEATAVPPMVERTSNGVNERQRKIMERLAAAGQVKISDFYDTFDAISSKTIQRDLQDLTTRNIIKKAGEKRWTTYMLA